MSFKIGKVVGGGDGSYPFNDLSLGERGEGLSAVGFVCEDVSIWGGGVDVLMVFKGLPWVGWAGLLGP